jgi:DNA polymerase-3 subunit alpha
MPGSSFVHLHVHSEYSMLDGAAKIGDLASEAARLGMPAIAVTDHGNVHAAYELYKAAREHGVKPIIGTEAYLAPGTHRSERRRVQWGNGGQDDVSGGGAYTHLTLLARTTTGMHNLFRLSSRASIEGFFYKPRMDHELIAEHAEGLLATTGCPSGEVQTWLRLGRYDEAVRCAARMREIVGADNYYCELMDHGLSLEKRVRADLLRLAREVGIPLLATNDLHYTRAEDSKTHEALLCVQSGSTLADPNRFRLEGDEYFLKTAERMRADFAELPEACDNTLVVAERCEVVFDEVEGRYMPRFPVPAGHDDASWMLAEVERGILARYPAGLDAAGRERVDYELGVIGSMGFNGYLLVVADFINWAKRQHIPVGPGRGSAAGSVICYLLGITDIDPLQHGLFFERFLNPERVSMPDIDIDFDDRRRDEVIRYVADTYGEDHVAQIVTFGSMKSKAALKDAARVLGHPFSLGEELTKAMPPAVMGKDIPLTGIFDPAHKRYQEAGELRALYESRADVREVVDTARGLENLKRNWGVHAAGVIMSSAPIQDVIPVMRREKDGAIITQFDYPTCETLGLIKMDFLGLRNLSVLDDAVANVRTNRGIDLDLDALGRSLDDPATYDLLARADTLGVFQLDGGPMRALLRSMRPDSFADISAVIALYRPGPMGMNSHNEYADRKNGRKAIGAIHPELTQPLAEILQPTYGVIVYQEQLMSIVQKVAGFTLGQADLLRKAMGKKKKEILDKEKPKFTAGMTTHGYSTAAAEALWATMEPFADYAFNKAHTAAYGLVSYLTAYLKANYPAEYMAALLTSVGDDKDKSALYLAECRRRGIKVLPPDVNDSVASFASVGADIRFGLAAVKNVGASVVDAIVTTRSESGHYADFADFLDKIPQQACTKRVVESLVKAGAFDSLGVARRALAEVHERAVEEAVERKKSQALGQYDLFEDIFSTASDAPAAASGASGFGFAVRDIAEWDKTTRLAFEREMLGLYVSDHPLAGVEHLLARRTDTSLGALRAEAEALSAPSPGITDPGESAAVTVAVPTAAARRDGATVTVGGLLTGLTRKLSRKGDPYAVATLEDLDGSIEVVFWPSTYALVADRLAEDQPLLVTGRLELRDEVFLLKAVDVTVPDLADVDSGPLWVSLTERQCTPSRVDQLKAILLTHPGPTVVHLHLGSPERMLDLRLSDRFRVALSPSLSGDLKGLLGPACLG